MTYQLVLQLPFSSIEDYDALIRLEARIIEALDDLGDVDGHDAGAGEMNVFVHTARPAAAFERLVGILWPDGPPPELKAAYRPRGGEAYTVLYPPWLAEFSVA